jgi:hypothetical protein
VIARLLCFLAALLCVADAIVEANLGDGSGAYVSLVTGACFLVGVIVPEWRRS